MPITFTNTTGDILPLNDLGIVPIPASSTIIFDHTKYNRGWISSSLDVKKAVDLGDLTIAYDCTSITDTYEAEVITFGGTVGSLHTVGKVRDLVVAKTSGSVVLVPSDPDDGDIVFSPVHKLEFFWDAARSKWLSLAIFEIFYCVPGVTAVNDYFCFQGVSATLGANFPLEVCFVTSMVQTNISGTADQTDFALMKNGVEDLVISIANGKYNEANLALNYSATPVLTTEEGYRIKVKAVEGGGTPPIDPLIILTYKLELV